jgi:hypothetical protein
MPVIPVGKTEIVFDPRRGAGLTAERAAVEHKDGETFRRGINGSRKARRPGADDGGIIDAIGIDRSDQADAARKLVFARIAQQLAARTKHDRQLPGIDMKAFDQRLCFGIGFGIEQLMRMTVAAQKTLQPQHVAILGPADDDRSAGAGFEQAHAAQDQCAHDALAEIGLRDKQRAQPVRLDDQRLHGFLGRGVDQPRPSGHLRQFAHELAGPMRDDQIAAAGLVALGNVDAAGKDDDKPRTDLPGCQQRLAGGKGAYFAEPSHPLDLDPIEIGKHLIATSLDSRLW